MNPFSNKNSVLVMDNAKIYHDKEMINLIEKISCKVLFLPLYSPNYNLIEIAFSTLKRWFRQNRDFMKTYLDPEYDMMVAYSQITSELAKSYFKKSLGFNF